MAPTARTQTRIYIVERADDPKAPPRLVRAQHIAQAVRHVAQNVFQAAVASQEDLVRLARSTDVEDAGADPAPAAPGEPGQLSLVTDLLPSTPERRGETVYAAAMPLAAAPAP